jgi:hypothetical protein
MSRLLIFSILIFFVSCETKQVLLNNINPTIEKHDSVSFFDSIDGFRLQYETRFPSSSDYFVVDSFFKIWANESTPINSVEFEELDSIERSGYQLYESLITDTSFIGINPDNVEAKYILIPNTLNFGYSDKYKLEYGIVFCDYIKYVSILNFRPRISFENKQILYYTRKYQEILPKFAEKHGVGGFINVDSYLMSNHLRYFETAPILIRIVSILNTDKYIVYYECKSRSYATLLKREVNKWIKIEDLSIIESD